MNDDRKKDALTELVDIAGSSGEESNGGRVSTPSGEMVELGHKLEIIFYDYYTKIKAIFRKKKQQEQEVYEYLIKKQDERKKANK